jgi:hypothetical protein
MYRNKPDPDNQSCRDGLALGFGFHQNTCFVSKHIGSYSTWYARYVNDIGVTHMDKISKARVPIQVVVIYFRITMMLRIYIFPKAEEVRHATGPTYNIKNGG